MINAGIKEMQLPETFTYLTEVNFGEKIPTKGRPN
jgi:hypothetical protein